MIEPGKNPVEIKHNFGGGVFIKEISILAGFSFGKHTHDYEHLSYLVHGDIALKVNNVEINCSGPVCLRIKKGEPHEVTAITDSLWLCIHAEEFKAEDIIDNIFLEKSN